VFCVCFVFLRLVHPTFPVSMQCTVYPIIVVFVVVTTTDAISGIPQDITTNVVSSNSTPARCPQHQHHVIKFVSYLLQVDGFLLVIRFPPPIKLTTTI